MVNMFLSVLVGGERHKLQSDGIVQPGLVNDNLDVVLLACLDGAIDELFAFLCTDNLDCILTLSNSFLPESHLLGKLIVVRLQLL